MLDENLDSCGEVAASCAGDVREPALVVDFKTVFVL